MKKILMRGVAIVSLLIAGATALMAQSAPELPQLPQDSNLIIGHLDNGLTYYIRHNEKPRGQADFYIAQKVGSILEEDNQRGLAHFLEHMCFNGTENFPEKGIINWLESVGVKFGRNLNAYTSVDETVYNISSVPVARKSVQDSCLLILHDWSTALTLAPEEIDAERGVIHEEWRQSNVGSMRIIESALPKMYPDSRYGYRLPIGTMDVVDNFPHQALVDYYHKWYRPDQQAVIVVGDIDPEYIEAKIKEIFSPIAMPENAAEREYFEVPDTPGTIFAIGSDAEMQAPVALMFFKTDDVQLPREMRNTQMFYLLDYMKNIAEIMINNRFSDLSKNPETLFASAEVSFGDYFLAKTKGAVSFEVMAKGNDIVPAFEAAYRELIRADQGGFTVGEYERARDEFISRVNRLYEERASRETESFSREYVRLFVDGYPAPGIEVEKPLYEQFSGLLNVDAINQWFQSLIQDDNRVVLILMPEGEGYTNPTEDALGTALEAIDEEDLEPYRDEVRTDPLIPSLPAAGSVSSTRHLDEWDATEYTLSNGVKVVVKPTTFKNNEIVFEALALGKAGSTLDQNEAASIMFAPMAMTTYGLNDYSNSDLQKYLAGKQLELDFNFSDYIRDMEGSTTVADLPTLMEMIYAFFTGFNITEQEYAAAQSMFAGVLANQETNPQFIFLKEVKHDLFAAPSDQSITPAEIGAAKRETIIDIYRNMMTNAADYTFYFAGSIDEATFVPLMEQYLATLPADAATATTGYTPNADFEIRTGSGEATHTCAMQTPQSWVFIVFGGRLDYTAKNKALATIASQILSKRLLNKVREEMGATYSIGANGSLGRTGTNNFFCQIAFPMKPELKDETLTVIRDIINDMTENISADELAPAVEYLNKMAAENLEKNDQWVGAMSATGINGVQTFTNAAEVLPGITVDDVKNFMRTVLEQNNYRTIVLDPDAASVAAAAAATPAAE